MVDERITKKIDFLKKLGVNPEPEINKLLDAKINKIFSELKSTPPKTKSTPQKPKPKNQPSQKVEQKSADELAKEVAKQI